MDGAPPCEDCGEIVFLKREYQPYRPVSLTSVIGQILQYIIGKVVAEHSENNNRDG